MPTNTTHDINGCGDSSHYDEGLLPEVQDPLFGMIAAGMQADGTVILDLGWAGIGLLNDLGIESFVAASGFENADAFYCWMQKASGSALPDWYGVQLRLFESWYLATFDEDYCYATWRNQPDEDALKSRAVDVFCLRHIAWQANPMSRRAFICARTRSYFEAAHIKQHPDAPATPAIMADVHSDGLKITGILPGQQEKSVLDWPTPQMATALALVANSQAAGVRSIHIWECGIGVQVDRFSEAERGRLLTVDNYYSGDMMLLDVLTRAGLLSR